MAHGTTSQYFEIMKAGWLLRQTEVLHRWKNCWVVVYTNGDLKYFESPDKLVAEETVVIPVEVQGVRRAEECHASPPEGRPPSAMFSLKTPDRTWKFCAEDADDCDAWLYTIEEARQARQASASQPAYQQYQHPQPAYQQYQHPQPPPPYYPAGGQQHRSQRVVFVENGCNVPARVIYQPDGNTVIVYEDGRPPYCHRHCCYSCNSCGLGSAVLGMAAGAMLFSPFMWWPLWC